MINKNKETTFEDIIEIFLPKLWIMLLVGVVLAAAISVYSVVVKDETYTSSSIVYVYNERPNSTATSTSDLQAAEQMVNVYNIAIKSDKFLKLVIGNGSLSEYQLSPEQIKRMIKVSQVDETAVFEVSVTSTNPDLAYDVACAITSGIEMYIQGSNGLVKNALLSSILEDPSVPAAPNSKGTVTKAIIAFAIGFIVTAVVVWAHSFFDVVIRSTKKIEENLDVPILGIIPRHEISISEEVKS